jgi:hypothetical protein
MTHLGVDTLGDLLAPTVMGADEQDRQQAAKPAAGAAGLDHERLTDALRSLMSWDT